MDSVALRSHRRIARFAYTAGIALRLKEPPRETPSVRGLCAHVCPMSGCYRSVLWRKWFHKDSSPSNWTITSMCCTTLCIGSREQEPVCCSLPHGQAKPASLAIVHKLENATFLGNFIERFRKCYRISTSRVWALNSGLESSTRHFPRFRRINRNTLKAQRKAQNFAQQQP